MDKVDELLERTGIELLPYQKEVLRHIANGERCYVIFPRRAGCEMMLRLIKQLNEMKGEDDG